MNHAVSLAGKAFSVSSTLMILLTRFVDGLIDVEDGSAASALLVPLFAGGLGVAFSLPFLVAILKEKKKGTCKSKG